MITPAKERMRKSRARRRLGLRPVQVLVSEQEIDFLLARHYELTRTDDRSIGCGGIRVFEQFSAGGGMTLSVEIMLRGENHPGARSVGDDKIWIHSSSSDHPLTILPNQTIQIVAIENEGHGSGGNSETVSFVRHAK